VVDRSLDLTLLLACLMQLLPSAVEDRAVIIKRVSSGRRVARQPATILVPHSIVDHIAMLTEAQKKLAVSVRPST